MTSQDNTDDDRTTWEEPREQAEIHGEKRTIPDQQRREIERRREGN